MHLQKLTLLTICMGMAAMAAPQAQQLQSQPQVWTKLPFLFLSKKFCSGDHEDVNTFESVYNITIKIGQLKMSRVTLNHAL